MSPRTAAAASAQLNADYAAASLSRVDSDGSCCSRSIGSGIRPPEYRLYSPLPEGGSRVDSDRSCCSSSIRRGLRLLEDRPWQEAGSRVDSFGS